MCDLVIDLTVAQVIRVSPAVIWHAWKDRDPFIRWWAPAPVQTTSLKHEFHAGGAFETSMKLDDGSIANGGVGCFL